MDSKIARRWVNTRLASMDYKMFVLADLYYDGYTLPEDFEALNVLDDFLGIDKSKCLRLVFNPLKRNVKKKMNYLLSRPFSVLGNSDSVQYVKDSLSVLKDTVVELYKKGEAWWEFEPDMDSPVRYKITLRKAQSIVPHYTNEEETAYDSVGYLWNQIDAYGKVTKYVDFVDLSGRHRFPISGTDESSSLDMGHAARGDKDVLFKSLPFVRITSDGLYSLISDLGSMYSNRYNQADSLLEDNADPVAVVKNASETDADTFMDDIRRTKLVKVEGTGDFSYATKSSDYSSIEAFMKMLKSDMADLCGVVSREQELNYVTSGRALDRLYVDMDNDAAEMGSSLRQALKSFLAFVTKETGLDYVKDFDIIFNTDKPTDEQQIIQNIVSSQSLLSKETLLAQHPWVEDVEQELNRIEKEKESEPQPEPVVQTQVDSTNQPVEEGAGNTPLQEGEQE